MHSASLTDPLRCAGGQVVDAGHPLHPKMPKGNLHTNQDLTLFGILEVFFDTIVVCTATALVIITTGVWHSGATSAALSAEAFRLGLPGNWGHIVVIVATVLFSYSTLLGWSWYAETGVSFLLGSSVVKPFRVIWCVFAFLGAIINITVVWNLADTVNGIMALPNLLSLWVFAGAAMKLTKEHFSKGDKQ